MKSAYAASAQATTLAARAPALIPPLPAAPPPQVLSWWGPSWREGATDTQGVATDKVLGTVLAEVAKHPVMKVAMHMEPYPGGGQGQGGGAGLTAALLLGAGVHGPVQSARPLQ
jgi:hypothetical protein